VAHAEQVQADGSPYVGHVVAVAELLSEAGYPDEVVAAGLLHDVVEKTDAGVGDVAAQFGPRVADLVAAVSEPAGMEPFAARKAALREQAIAAGADAAAVFAADKLSRAAGVRAALAAGPGAGPEEPAAPSLTARLDQLWRALERLELTHPSLPFLQPLRAELAALDGLPDAPAATV
jgi:hypothetical protein